MRSGVRTRPKLELTEFHGFVTVSPQMRRLFELLERISRTDASILLRGETGTGKELAATAVHTLSGRSQRPFRAINCAVLTPELAASELFGHVRGAFTGAIRERQGLFALANGGSVFLDEIAELPLDIQGRLLRVLQEHAYVPVGGTDTVHTDIRLIAATHRSLRDEVEAGRFREDLMYRVRVVPVFIPPLAERSGDVEALCWHFIEAFNRAGHRSVTEIDEDAMTLMLEYPWPGNVRELRNVVEYAFAVGRGTTLRSEDFPPELRGELPPRVRNTAKNEAGTEKSHILDAMRMSDGSKSRAAQLLGISRTTLWRKMRELGI